MKRATVTATLALALLAAAPGSHAETPDLNLLEGSYVILGVAGAQRPLGAQSVGLKPAWQTGQSIRSIELIDFPRVDLAFGEFVDIYQNQQLSILLDSASGAATLKFPAWVIDSDGNGVELDLNLTTATPSDLGCNGFPYCLGIQGDPAYCSGSPWDPVTGDVRFVGVTRVPFQSGTTVDCSPVVVVLEAFIPRGDADLDTVQDALDNCPDEHQAALFDSDGDGIGDACDNCVGSFNPGQRDSDQDGAGDACQPFRINFQPAGAPVPAGFTPADGSGFNAGAGQGWLGGPAVQTRDREMLGDQSLDTLAFTVPPRDWELIVPLGLYEIAASVGDPQFPQGPHRLLVESRLLVDEVATAAGQHVTEQMEQVTVADGRITLGVGGGAGGSATSVNWLTAVEEGEQPFHSRFVNFQPGGSSQPDGFEVDSGEAYDPARGHGWDQSQTANARDRGMLGDPVLDTFVFAIGGRTWELDLPPDFYDVQVSIGDAQYPHSNQSLSVEGQPWFEGVDTAAGEFLTLSRRVKVEDASLSIAIGESAGYTHISYVSVTSLKRDLDSDGVSNSRDNCIEVANPDQADADGDGVGDLCAPDGDSDGWSDAVDNCPDDPNPSQANGDSDARGDVCDCAPGDDSAYEVPSEVDLLVLSKSAPTTADLAWSEPAEMGGSGTGYDVVTGSIMTLHQLGSFQGASCLVQDASITQHTDLRVPSVDDGYLYLVRGDNACGGTYGFSVSPARAVLDASGPCP